MQIAHGRHETDAKTRLFPRADTRAQGVDLVDDVDHE